MKLLLLTIVALMAIASTQAACGCLKCSKNLYVASPPTAPVKVIYRGGTGGCYRDKALPYTIEQPIIQRPKPVILRDYTYRAAPIKVVKKVIPETPESYYEYQVQVPINKPSSCHKCLVGLVAHTDRVVLPGPSCRHEKETPGKGPVFEPLSTIEEDEYSFEPYPIKRCGCARYAMPLRPHFVSRIKDTVDTSNGNLTQQQIDERIEQNIREIFFDDSPLGRMKRFFHFTLPKIVNTSNRNSKTIRKKRDTQWFEETLDIPKVQEDSDSEETFEEREFSNREPPRATEVFLENLNWDHIVPQVPLLFFVNAPVRLMARFHSLNKHLEPVVQSVPMVVRTSSRFMGDFGKRIHDGFVGFLRIFMKTFTGRRKRSLDEHKYYTLIPIKVYPNDTADFALINPYASRKDLAFVYFMHSNAKAQKRTKRQLFELDLDNFLKEKWGASNDLQSAEVIFQDHFNQIPRLYDALKEIRDHSNTVRFPHLSYPKRDDILGDSHGEHFTNGDFAHLHPDKNLMILKKEVSNVLDVLQKLIRCDIEKDLSIYEELLKLQYLKSALVVDWRKDLQGPRGIVVTSKMNILNYIKEIDRFRASVNKRLLAYAQSHLASYNRSECVFLLVELYKLQIIFHRIYEDLNDRISVAGKFSPGSEMKFIQQLDKLQFIDKTNKFDIEQHLKSSRDKKVKDNMEFLDKLRFLADFEDGYEMNDDEHREEVNEVARMIQENAHYKGQQLKVIQELMQKVHMKQNCRKELKKLWDLERSISENEEKLMKKTDDDPYVMMKQPASSESLEKEETKGTMEETFKLPNLGEFLKLPTPKIDHKSGVALDKSMKEKLAEFLKLAEDKHEALVKKTQKLVEIMKEP